MSKTNTPESLYKQLRLNERQRKQRPFRRVTSSEARKELCFGTSVKSDGKDYSGTAIEGYDLHGKHRGVNQVRRDNPEIDERGKPDNKYVSRPRSAGPRYINTTPGPLKEKDHVYVVEAPKSVWALTAHLERAGEKNFKVADTNGLDGWRVRESDDPNEASRPNPDLALLAGHRVTLIPDSNAFREDLKPKVAALSNYLLEIGATSVDVARVPALDGVNGPDDLIALKNGDKLMSDALYARQALWKYEFPAVSDFNDEEIKSDLLIEHLIANKSLTILASPSENYKSTFAMVVCRSLLDGTGADTFDCEEFAVIKGVPGVLYCCPDMSHEMTVLYARKFGLHEGKFAGRFRIRTMKQGDILGPDNPLLLQAARSGWFIVFDTLNYFTDADDDNNPQQLNKFIVKCRKLVDKHGASGLMMLAHPTKTGARSNEVDVTEWVSGTYAKIGSVDTIFCMRKIEDESGVPMDVWVGRAKSRPFLGVRLEPFKLALYDGQGSTIDRGAFPIRTTKAGPLRDSMPKKPKGGAPEDPEKGAKLKFIAGFIKENTKPGKRLPNSVEIAFAMNRTFNPTNDPDKNTNDRTIRRWREEMAKDSKLDREFMKDSK